MVLNVVLYLVGVLTTVGGALLIERLVAGPHVTAGTGYARLDSIFDLDRLRTRRLTTATARLRRGRPGRTLPVLRDVIGGPRHVRDAGEQFIPVARIVGSVDGAAQLFDRSFRPVSDRARARLGSVLAAMREGNPLPPIEVRAWRGQYYVFDGHHRVAAARALGSSHIVAHVVELD
jgi:hypothetical protein